jgi:C1A family cysteine protease
MRKIGFIIGIIVLLMAVMPLSVPVNDSVPAQAAGPPVPVEPPSMPPPPPYQPPPVIDGHGTGALASTTGVVHISGQRMPDGSLVGESPVGNGPPASFDWRTQNKVTSVKNQGACGACYAHAGIANVESKVLIDTNTTTPGPDYSENNAKECDWRAINNWTDPSNYTWGSCYGGNYYMLASLFSHKGIVDETDDPYVASNTACNSSCPYNKTLLDWRIISGPWTVPNTTVLKTYIQTYGPVYTTLYVGDLTNDPAWYNEFANYDGSYTLYKTTPYYHNHAVLIVGWDDNLTHAGPGSGGWIVKNSWGTTWGAAGYFTIAYGSAHIGEDSSFMYDWQDYNNNGSIMYYDDDYQNDYVGYSNKTGWGLCNFTPTSNTYATRVEFWTVDTTTDVDVYIYDDFDPSTTSLSNLLRSQFNYSYVEPGYHSVPLSSPLPLTAGDPVIVVVKFTDASWNWPVPTDQYGPNETALTYTSPWGTNWSWYDVSSILHEDVCIRLRTSDDIPSYNLTMAVNGNGTTTPAVGNHTYTVGTVVNINATPDAGWQFVNWTTANMSEIANATAASTTVTVDENKTVTANFVEQFTLTMAVTGNGTTDPVGSHSYANGTVVPINATPDPGWHFVNWTTANMSEIANATAASTTVTVDKTKTVTANFLINQYNLTINSTAGGNVTIPGEGTFGPYNHGTVVNLTATPDANYTFINWTTANMSEIANPTAASTTVTVDENKTVTAHFAVVTGATLVGNATFLRKEAPPDPTWQAGLVVRGFVGGNKTWERNVTTNDTGVFTITGLTPGTYDIGMKNHTTLSKVVSGVTLSSTANVSFGDPKEGDVNDDNKCNILDLSALGSSFGLNIGPPPYNKWADFNRDDKVNILDLSALGGNFGLNGQQPW